MEENKLNLKPFNLKSAKAGNPVCTRDGRKARIICFDRKGGEKYNGFSIIALITENSDDELIGFFDEKGNASGSNSSCDLMMLPEKKEGWINIYDADTTFRYVNGRVYKTKDEAVQEAEEGIVKKLIEKNEYVDTIKITWEE